MSLKGGLSFLISIARVPVPSTGICNISGFVSCMFVASVFCIPYMMSILPVRIADKAVLISGMIRTLTLSA